jgi:uncharacterized protein YndB with AHSA1/START domain
MTPKTDAADTSHIVLTRVLNAPRDLVWTVWTDPKHAQNWWGPHGFTTPVYESDLRPGGALVVHMQAPNGQIFPSTGTFEEVVTGERIVFFGAIEIEPGTVAFHARTFVTFEDEGTKTKVTVRQEYEIFTPAGKAATGGAKMGWNQQFERLAEYLRTHATG